MLWSGGKDSSLALHRALDAGVDVVRLATFVPDSGADFLAHPRALIKKQAVAMGLGHSWLPVNEPFADSYEKMLKLVHEETSAEAVITGDIDLVGGQPNWIVERCSPLNLEVMRPLWKEDRKSLMAELLARGIRARITWINHPSIPKSMLGRVIDAPLLGDLQKLADRVKIDLSGENGEYHTMVMTAPSFKTPIEV